MRHALGKVPDVTVVKLLNLVSSELVDGGDQDGPSVHKTPLSDPMPMQFTDGALLEMLLGSRDVVALGKILDDLLTEPSTLEEPRLGVREAPLEVRYNAIVRGLLSEVVRVGDVNLMVRAAYIDLASVSD